MPESVLRKDPRLAYRTDPYTLGITDDIDVLMVFRTHADTWGDDQEKKAVNDHAGVYNFLADCVAHKKEVYGLIKSLKAADAAGE